MERGRGLDKLHLAVYMIIKDYLKIQKKIQEKNIYFFSKFTFLEN